MNSMAKDKDKSFCNKDKEKIIKAVDEPLTWMESKQVGGKCRYFTFLIKISFHIGTLVD
jgi:hypothetical protein